jgi:hypothetical protein
VSGARHEEGRSLGDRGRSKDHLCAASARVCVCVVPSVIVTWKGFICIASSVNGMTMESEPQCLHRE